MGKRTDRLLFALAFLLSAWLPAQDTLTFSGVDLPVAEVRTRASMTSPLAQSFTIEEVRRLPATFYDPARLVALLPGVVQTNDQANHLSVRGNTPNANLWRINGLAIVNPNHTANAGTLYDLPTLTGGGVNAISAQMVDRADFYAGGLPIRYGYAPGGTFDLQLRPGRKTGRRHQLQAGLIGFDAATEGPIGDGKTSYLINGRYSFTGLLADMGVDFGGEEIRFADVNAYLNHRTDKGEFGVFALYGGSENIFRYDEEEARTEAKEFYDIDFESDVAAVGAHFTQGKLQGGLAYSVLDSERRQERNDEDSGNSIDNYKLNHRRFSGNLLVGDRLGDRFAYQAGIEVLGERANALGESADFFVTSPFASIALRDGGPISAELGLRFDAYGGEGLSEVNFTPRVKIEAAFAENQRLFLIAESFSQPPLVPALLASRDGVIDRAPVTAAINLGYGRKIAGANARMTLFAQRTVDDYFATVGGFYVSTNNLLEIDESIAFSALGLGTDTRRLGIELEAAGGRRSDGIYYRGNVTVLTAETEQRDGSWAKDRWANNFSSQLFLGREWNGQSRKRDLPRTHGVSLALIAHGGLRRGQVRPPLFDQRAYPAPQNLEMGFSESLGTYFRPDLRLYRTVVGAKTTRTLALDVQNLAGVQNVQSVIYDPFLSGPNERTSLGIVPVLSYRIVWE